MTLQQLQYLVALAESNSINQAAQNLFVSQSGISKAIKQLESELGFPLLERSSRGITFTSRGTEFLHDAYSLIKQFHTMQDHYLQTEPQGMITMSITSRYYIFVAKAVAKMANLLKEHNYFIRLQEGKVSDIIQDVAARRSQLGFISYYDTNAEFIQHELERFNLEFHSLCSNQLHVFLSKNHPLAKEPNITLSMLSPYPYIFYDGGNDPYGYTEEVFFPVHPQKSIAVSDRSSMLNIIRHSECYNLGSGWLLEGYSESDLITRMWQPVGVSLALYPTMIPTQSLFSMSLSASIWNSTVFAATSSMFSCPRTIRLPKNPISPSPCSVLTHISSTTAATIHTAILRRSFSPYIRKNPSPYQTVAPC